MSSKSVFPPASATTPASHFAVIIDEFVVGLVADCSARTATLMAAQGITYERIDGPLPSDEMAAITRMNEERAARRQASRPVLRLIRGGKSAR